MPTKTAPAVSAVDRLRDAAAKTTKTMRIVVDHEHADLALADGVSDDVREALLDEASVKMTFRSIGRKAYRELVDRHSHVPAPPARATKPDGENETDEEVEEVEAAPELDYETFIPELVAACCIDPVMTLEETTEILDGWSALDVTELYVTCMQLCNKSRVGELGKGSSQTSV
jgi:hypothetical protein